MKKRLLSIFVLTLALSLVGTGCSMMEDEEKDMEKEAEEVETEEVTEPVEETVTTEVSFEIIERADDGVIAGEAETEVSMKVEE